MNELDEAFPEFFEALGEPGGEPLAPFPTPVRVNWAEVRVITEKKQFTFSRRMNQLSKMELLEKIDEGATTLLRRMDATISLATLKETNSRNRISYQLNC